MSTVEEAIKLAESDAGVDDYAQALADSATVLAAEVRRLRAQVADLQPYRWHATYNAALTGIHARGWADSVKNRHEDATAAANLAHGELAK